MVITAPRILPKAIPKIPLPDMPTSAELTKMWLDTAALIMGGVGGGSALHLLYHESREEQEKKIIAILEKTLEEKRLRGENAEMPITREQALKFWSENREELKGLFDSTGEWASREMAQRIPTISRDEIKSVTKPEVPEVESESVQPASVEDVRNNLRGVTETMAKEMEPLRPGKGGYMPSIIEEFSNSGYFIITSHLDLAVLILVLSVVFGLIFSMLYLRIIAKDLTALNKIISLSSASPARMLLFIIIGFIGYMAWSYLWSYISYATGISILASMILAALSLYIVFVFLRRFWE